MQTLFNKIDFPIIRSKIFINLLKLKEKIGYFFFGASLVLGYGIPLIFTFCYSQSYDEKWLIGAGIAYCFSWILFAGFILINGKKAYINIKNFIYKKFID